jgi:hypothetical protein
MNELNAQIFIQNCIKHEYQLENNDHKTTVIQKNVVFWPNIKLLYIINYESNVEAVSFLFHSFGWTVAPELRIMETSGSSIMEQDIHFK